MRAPPARLRPVHLPTIHASVLPNGLSVQYVRHGTAPLASARLLIRAGSASDPRGREGVADLTTQLLRRGTRRRSARALDEAVEQVGGSLAIGSGPDWLAVRVGAPSQYLEPLLGLIAELVRFPRFDPSELRAARTRALAELANDKDDPELVADRALARQLWGAHPYGTDGSGTPASLSRIRREDVRAFHGEQLGPRVSLLTLVGDLDRKSAAAAVSRAFGPWRGGPAAPPTLPDPAPPPGAGSVLWLDRRELTQSQIRIGWRSLRRSDPRVIPGFLVNHVLGGGFISRLVKAARVERGLTYGISSHFDWLVHGGTHEISTSTETSRTGEMLTVVLSELARMKARGPGRAELAAAQRYVVGLYPASLERNESIAGKLGDIWMFGLPSDWISRYRERIADVTLGQAVTVARQVLSPHAPAIVVVGNAAKASQALKKVLGTVRVVPLAEYE